jgi:ketosteroid isomerase-like protein
LRGGLSIGNLRGIGESAGAQERAMSDANKAVALQFMEAMSTNDPELADRVTGPGAVAVAKGTSKFAGTRSREMMVGGIALFKQMIPTGLRFEIGNVTAEGDRVVVEAQGNAVTAGGEPYCNQYCFVFTVQGGKIAHVNEYFCGKLAENVLWPMAEKAGGMHAMDA